MVKRHNARRIIATTLLIMVMISTLSEPEQNHGIIYVINIIIYMYIPLVEDGGLVPCWALPV